ITVRRRRSKRPIFFTAHLDHPAFVVRHVLDERTVELEFRGGVHEPYFEDARVEIFDGEDAAHAAVILELTARGRPFKRFTARLRRPTRDLRPGDVGRWALARGGADLPRIRGGLLHAPACDDLAGAAAALSALDLLRNRASGSQVGVLLTRAEEVGFIGATAACKHRTIADGARLICLENSRSFADSPLGEGPILRVGDKMSVFSPALTNRLSRVLADHQKRHPRFRWQRKLMPGGTCEATTFGAFGYESTCVCLALGNYHNMSDIDGVLAGRRPARVAPEFISIADYHGMIELLVVGATQLDSPKAEGLSKLMEDLLARSGHVLEGAR
ncbi:MAG: hypothetical protein ACYSXF_07020, partial [Planctomycetota bacterium]